jgi:hypothetical protein
MRTGTVSIPAENADADGDGLPVDSTGVTTAPVATAATAAPTVVPSTVAPVTTAPVATPAPTPTPTTVAPTTAPPPTSPPTSAPISPQVVFAGRCESSAYGWDVGVPQGWYGVDDPDGWWTCAGFERFPVSVTFDSEIVVPITITFLEGELAADVLAGYADGSFVGIVDQRPATVGIYDAWRLETTALGDAFVPAGTPGITYVVDRGGWSTVLIDGFGFSPADFAEVEAIVDAMAGDIAFWDS